MLSDAITSVAVVIGAIVISIWKIYWVDPVLTIAASVFLLKEAYEVTIKAANILMETNPKQFLVLYHRLNSYSLNTE